MKRTKDKTSFYFVDESGDPTFYDKRGNLILGTEGVSKILILGFVKTDDPKSIRKGIHKLQREVACDPYLEGIPSLEKTLITFHAKDDCAEVRERVFRTIAKFDFNAEIVVARKIPAVFNERHRRSEHVFYDDLVSRLFENRLHLAKQNEIFFATRGSKPR